MEEVVKNKKVLTLTIVHQGSSILLGMKKRGFGSGKWNGFGGKVEQSETIEEAAKRELLEEAGITSTKLQKLGMITFRFNYNQDDHEVHIFKATSFSGDPTESDEMKPKWFHIDDIPFKDMWADDIYWMPLLLQNKPFQGEFLFDQSDTILEQTLTEVQAVR